MFSVDGKELAEAKEQKQSKLLHEDMSGNGKYSVTNVNGNVRDKVQ